MVVSFPRARVATAFEVYVHTSFFITTGPPLPLPLLNQTNYCICEWRVNSRLHYGSLINLCCYAQGVIVPGAFHVSESTPIPPQQVLSGYGGLWGPEEIFNCCLFICVCLFIYLFVWLYLSCLFSIVGFVYAFAFALYLTNKKSRLIMTICRFCLLPGTRREEDFVLVIKTTRWLMLRLLTV